METAQTFPKSASRIILLCIPSTALVWVYILCPIISSWNYMPTGQSEIYIKIYPYTYAQTQRTKILLILFAVYLNYSFFFSFSWGTGPKNSHLKRLWSKLERNYSFLLWKKELPVCQTPQQRHLQMHQACTKCHARRAVPYTAISFHFLSGP